MDVPLDRDNGPTLYAVQSTHKMLAAFSSASMIHIRPSARAPVNYDIFNQAFMMYGTTSPFYPLIASIDVATAMMEGEAGRTLVNEAINDAINFRKMMVTVERKLKQESPDNWFFCVWQPTILMQAGKPVPFINVPNEVLANDASCWLLIAAVCYVSSCTVIMGLVLHHVLIGSAAPFADAARYMFGTFAGEVVSLLSIIACFGSICGGLILQSEAPGAGAREELFPKFFAEVNKNDVPMKGLIFTGVLMTAVLLTTASPNLSKQFKIIGLMSVFASLLPYMYALVALPIIMVAKSQGKGGTLCVGRHWHSLQLVRIVWFRQ